MKDDKNLINILLIVAIVLAVGGTWLNLSKLNEVKTSVVSGAAIAGITPTVVEEATGDVTDAPADVNTLDPAAPTTTDNPEISATADCWLPSNYTKPKPANYSTEPNCTLSGTFRDIYVGVGTNIDGNLTHWNDATVLALWSVAQNHRWLGYCENLTTLGNTSNGAAWKLGVNSGWLLTDNITAGNKAQIIDYWGIDYVPMLLQIKCSKAYRFYYLTPQGNVTDTFNFAFVPN